MQPETLVQGTSLEGRYRLEEQVGASPGDTLWRALDTVLSRRVSIRTLDQDSPRADATLAAARAASVISDPRLVRVLDASRVDGLVYVVTEWVTGVSLAEQMSAGPLEPGEATYVVKEAAEALATAHRAGVGHLRLHPGNVLRSRTGEVRVTGLGVAAALADVSSPDPGRADARALGCLLYAALTARWPGHQNGYLPEAPTEDGHLCTPRQVRAGVPGRLDAVTMRAIDDGNGKGQPPYAGPAEFAAALAELPHRPLHQDTMALPMLPPDPAQSAGRNGNSSGDTPPSWPAAAWPAPADAEPARSSPSRGTVAVRRGLVAVALVAVLVAAWQVALEIVRPDGSGGQGGGPSASGSSGEQAAKPVDVVDVTDFDPQSDDGQEHPEETGLATDGNPGTAWETMEYFNRPDLGGLKQGVGLVLDLGQAKPVHSVKVQLNGSGTDLELRGSTTEGSSASDFRRLDRVQDAGEQVTLEPAKPTRARYVLIWLTSLPPSDSDRYRGSIAEISVRS